MLCSVHAVGRFLPLDTPESGGCCGWEGAGVARDGRGTVLALPRGAMLTAAPLPAVHPPRLWASPKPCCRNGPHAGRCLPHLGTMSGAMGPGMEI